MAEANLKHCKKQLSLPICQGPSPPRNRKAEHTPNLLTILVKPYPQYNTASPLQQTYASNFSLRNVSFLQHNSSWWLTTGQIAFLFSKGYFFLNTWQCRLTLLAVMQIQPPDSDFPNQAFTEKEKKKNLRRSFKRKEKRYISLLVERLGFFWGEWL